MSTVKKTPDNMKIYEGHREAPKEALKTLQAGRLKGMSDINPQWRIEALTETYGLYGVGWFVQIKGDEFVDLPETQEKMIFLTLELYVRDWSIPDEYKWFGPAIGIGGDYVIVRDKNGVHGNDEAYAMAMTDALGKAAKLFGIANDIYRGKFDSKYGWRDENARKEKQQEIKSESYQIRNDGLYIRGQAGFVHINSLSKEQLEAIKDFKKFDDVRYLIEKRLAEL